MKKEKEKGVGNKGTPYRPHIFYARVGCWVVKQRKHLSGIGNTVPAAWRDFCKENKGLV